jgi:hypothetical protein
VVKLKVGAEVPPPNMLVGFVLSLEIEGAPNENPEEVGAPPKIDVVAPKMLLG